VEPGTTTAETTAAPDLSQSSATASGRMALPVQGDIVRDYEKGKNDGIDIAASPGSAVRQRMPGPWLRSPRIPMACRSSW
jgi:septal ring factor EnvC (AmiA/AmiB activator)